MNITELARRAGISKGAVSLALRDHPSISEATRTRVKALARKLGYTPDPTLSKVMSAVARRRIATITAPIAILSLWPTRRAWQSADATLQRFYQGLVRRAKELGFSTEEFWMGNNSMSPQRMHQILVSRGIEGLIVMNYPKAPAVLDMDLSPFASAVIGRALLRPRLFATDHDHHQGLFQVIQEIEAAGYSRPALLLSKDAHERTMYCWASAYEFYSSTHRKGGRIPTLILDGAGTPRPASGEVTKVRQWFRRYRPDAIISVQRSALPLLEAAGISIPRDVGFATLFWEKATDGCAGLDLQDEVVAARAVELVVEQLHHNQKGIPAAAETVLFPGVWRPGASLPSRPAQI